MFIKTLRCYVCGQNYPRTQLFYRCKCGGGLQILYDYSRLKKSVSWTKLRQRPSGHWRYAEFYPAVHRKITLSEGGTPLARSSAHLKLFFKLEGTNPTGSFKDRGSTVEISHALESNALSVVCASTGNMGASVAAYCARAGLLCEIILPKDTPSSKIGQIKTYHARITSVKGDYTHAMNKAYLEFQNHQKFLVGDYAFRGEGEKSIGFEIVDEFLKQYDKIPDYILVPVGNGTMISGVWKGLKEFKEAGLIRSLPKLIGVQARGCNPLEVAFRNGKPVVPIHPKTVAGAVACGDPLDAVTALRAISESGGGVFSFKDEEIIAHRKELARTEGIDGEPSAVLGYAAWKLLGLEKYYCVCIITGNGLKDLKNV